ncbi:MAG: hypothetical protein JJ863_15495 [Deltaproteobacteria bacterium]|nr:hypothetical protein [Deltaproteobacteria bacterium]
MSRSQGPQDAFVELRPVRPVRTFGPRRHWRPYLYVSALHTLTVFVLTMLVPEPTPYCDPVLSGGPWTVLMGPLACLLPIDGCRPWQVLSPGVAAVVVGTVLCCHAWVLRWTGWAVAVSLMGWFVWLSWGCMASVMGI